MSVAENMGFGLKMRGEASADIDRQVSSAAEILALQSLLDRFPRQLSGGQRQRVAMGRAIVRNPEVFLFDEPLSNLDAKLRVQMRTEIRELQQRLGTTTVYVTHDQVEAMTMADKIVVMNGGRIEQVGTPLALYDQPANLFVAEFLGSPGMNLLEGRIEREGRPRFVVGDAAFPLDAAALPAGDAVLGFRPEHLRIVEHGVAARVVAVEPTGLDTILIIELDGHHITGIFRQRFALRPGDRIEVSVAPEHIHLFDRVSGDRHN
jgi:multiple sugar transport system ATP-binding protein